MRELLLLATILLGQLAPNGHLLTQVTNKLRLAPAATATKEVPKQTGAIITRPTKKIMEDYTASAQSVYSIDLDSNATLASKDTDKRLQIASLTKLMTAYVILREDKLDTIYTVPTLNPQSGDALMGINTGERLSVRSLLYGLLINSGSDAAQTLAVGSSGSVDAFVSKMNDAASELKLANTHFANPVGWDDRDNYSSAKDLTELTRVLLRSETFAEIVKTKSKIVVTESGRQIPLTTTNQLLYNAGFAGVKTGYTYGAGECLVSLYLDGKTHILTTVIGSAARFAETESIKGWILNHFSW